MVLSPKRQRVDFAHSLDRRRVCSRRVRARVTALMQIRSDHLPTILAKRQMGDGAFSGMWFG